MAAIKLKIIQNFSTKKHVKPKEEIINRETGFFSVMPKEIAFWVVKLSSRTSKITRKAGTM
jgi:hypothetical protein